MTEIDIDIRIAPKITTFFFGPPGSGKTSFVKQLIQARFFQPPEPTKIIWVSKYEDPDLNKLPYRVHYSGDINVEPTPGCLMVVDDFFQATSNSDYITSLVSRGVTHEGFRLFLLSQNMFHKGKETRSQSLCGSYLAVFKNLRDGSQFSPLARQLAPDNSQALIQAYLESTRSPYTYLWIDCRPSARTDVRFFADILSKTPIVYQASDCVYLV